MTKLSNMPPSLATEVAGLLSEGYMLRFASKMVMPDANFIVSLIHNSNGNRMTLILDDVGLHFIKNGRMVKTVHLPPRHVINPK